MKSIIPRTEKNRWSSPRVLCKLLYQQEFYYYDLSCDCKVVIGVLGEPINNTRGLSKNIQNTF